MSLRKPKRDKYNSKVDNNPDDWWYSLKTKAKIQAKKFVEGYRNEVIKNNEKAFKANKKP